MKSGTTGKSRIAGARRPRLARAWSIGIVGYVSGIGLSAAFDVPTGPLIVWTLLLVGIAYYALSARGLRTTATVAG
ncbi:MAG: hypothetical protein ABI316_12040 [Casimicrobiaceae bacterium]